MEPEQCPTGIRKRRTKMRRKKTTRTLKMDPRGPRIRKVPPKRRVFLIKSTKTRERTGKQSWSPNNAQQESENTEQKCEGQKQRGHARWILVDSEFENSHRRDMLNLIKSTRTNEKIKENFKKDPQWTSKIRKTDPKASRRTTNNFKIDAKNTHRRETKALRRSPAALCQAIFTKTSPAQKY